MSLARLKTCFNISIRMYHKNKSVKKFQKHSKKIANPGIQLKLKTLKATDNIFEADELIDPEDYSEFESDFFNAGEMHKQHEWEEIKAKEMLKLQITKRKFLEKEKEPSFVTFSEKTEIINLHKKDPQYWTIFRLSESFPALPETIKKILRAEWMPKTIKTVQNYDKHVIENWERFRSGQLALDMKLTEHLEKFQDRQIKPADENYITTHLLEPRIEFPKPRNSLFTNYINSIIPEPVIKKQNLITSGTNDVEDKKPTMKRQNLITSSKNDAEDEVYVTSSTEFSDNLFDKSDSKEKSNTFVKNIIQDEEKQETISNVRETKQMSFVRELRRDKYEPQLFSEFVKKSVEKSKNENTTEAMVMRDVYKKNLLQEEQKKKQKLMDLEIKKREDKLAEHETEENRIAVQKDEERNIEEKKERKTVKSIEVNESEKGELQTRVVKWVKLHEEESDYPLCIKIPKSRYKKGMTYRVKDCYYDDDGEFLYRVPGLKT